MPVSKNVYLSGSGGIGELESRSKKSNQHFLTSLHLSTDNGREFPSSYDKTESAPFVPAFSTPTPTSTSDHTVRNTTAPQNKPARPRCQMVRHPPSGRGMHTQPSLHGELEFSLTHLLADTTSAEPSK
jgi:hypothetical protein